MARPRCAPPSRAHRRSTVAPVRVVDFRVRPVERSIEVEVTLAEGRQRIVRRLARPWTQGRVAAPRFPTAGGSGRLPRAKYRGRRARSRGHRATEQGRAGSSARPCQRRPQSRARPRRHRDDVPPDAALPTHAPGGGRGLAADRERCGARRARHRGVESGRHRSLARPAPAAAQRSDRRARRLLYARVCGRRTLNPHGASTCCRCFKWPPYRPAR